MATLKQRLNRKNSSGTYDTIHLETSSTLVLRSDGSTVEDALDSINTSLTNGVKPTTHASTHRSVDGTDPLSASDIGAAASDHNHDDAYSKTGHTHSNYAASTHNHAAGDINSGTLGVARGGTGASSFTANRLIYPSAATTISQLAFPSVAGSVLRQGTSGAPYWTSLDDLKTAMNITVVDTAMVLLGSKISWEGRPWIVVHVTSSAVYLMYDGLYSITPFGNTTNTYKDSTLAGCCTEFQNTLCQYSLDMLLDVTVYGVTENVFVPGYNADGNDNSACIESFTWLSDSLEKYLFKEVYAHRIGCGTEAQWSQYSSSASTTGYRMEWWLSQPDSSSSNKVHHVNIGGSDGISYSTFDSLVYGFRPFVAVSREYWT